MTGRPLLATLWCIALLCLHGCDFGCAPDPVIATAQYRVVGGSRPELVGAIVSVIGGGLVISWADVAGYHTGVYEYAGGDFFSYDYAYDSGDPSDSGTPAAAK